MNLGGRKTLSLGEQMTPSSKQPLVVREDFELPAGGGDTRENMWPTPFGVLSSAAAVGPQASGMWGVELEAPLTEIALSLPMKVRMVGALS
ncbi:Os05g0231800 [Oryza sativa Japonica Group]|uniref:Os05g0231800 protein n=1 Tax=Oryza sativa subsp. japonica TaxID=39947 RepID=A0A0N7KKD6_ORYSJ|nr:Os05g0231800 [Oryza sativa Japonica Group]